MNILTSLLLIVLVVVTTGFHGYFVWRKKDYKTLFVQVGLAGIAVIVGILIINNVSEPSISTMLNLLSPFQK